MQWGVGMAGSSNTAIKVIVVTGVLVFVLMFAASLGLKKSLKPDERERARALPSASPFDASRAMEHLTTLLANGPRVAGSLGLSQARGHIAAQARGARLRVREVPGIAGAVHVVGETRGRKEGCILVLTHYDAWASPDPAYLGASDGAATSAGLLALAEAYGDDFFGRSLVFAWLDGAAESPEQAAKALEQLLDALSKDPKQPRIAAAIYVDGMGDCYLRIAGDPGAPEWMADLVREVATTQGRAEHFGAPMGEASSVSKVFAARGIPALVLADRVLGGSVLEHTRLWHTSLDTVAQVCPESLKAFGDVLYHALAAIDGRLDGLGSVGR